MRIQKLKSLAQKGRQIGYTKDEDQRGFWHLTFQGAVAPMFKGEYHINIIAWIKQKDSIDQLWKP